MQFSSILFLNNHHTVLPAETSLFSDLNLDQIFSAALYHKEEYELTEFFYTPLCTKSEVYYRQKVMQDLVAGHMQSCINIFAEKMRDSRQWEDQAEKSYDPHSANSLHLRSISTYIEAVKKLRLEITEKKPRSNGLNTFLSYVNEYVESDTFTLMCQEVDQIIHEFESIDYTLHIKGNDINIRPYNQEAALDPIITEFFSRFEQENIPPAKQPSLKETRLNHVEEMIINQLALLYPDYFSRLNQFCNQIGDFRDSVITRFDREIQFYLAYLQCINTCKKWGLNFCYPIISSTHKELFCTEGCDLALQLSTNTKVIGNTFALKGKERILIVTGPNQGGKTTFLRSFGQAHLMMSCGMITPSAAFQAPIGRIFTHFKQEEDTKMQSGKFDEELSRMRDLIDQIHPGDFVLMNESFAATNEREGSEIAAGVLDALMQCKIRIIFVTHFYIFAEHLFQKTDVRILFLRAMRQESGKRTFQLEPGPPLRTGFGLDIYQRFFHINTPPPADNTPHLN